MVNKKSSESDFATEREILYKVLFDMKSDLNDLKKVTLDLIKNSSESEIAEKNQNLIEKIYGKESYTQEKTNIDPVSLNSDVPDISKTKSEDKYDYVETIEELSLIHI